MHIEIWQRALAFLMPVPPDFRQVYEQFRPEWAGFTYKLDEDIIAFQNMVSFLTH